MRRRLDHARYHICISLANVAIALFILWHWRTPTALISPVCGGIVNPVIGRAGMSLWMENVNGIVLFIGAAGQVFGWASGTKYFRPKTDIRDSYIIGGWASLLVAAAVGSMLIGVIWSYWPRLAAQFVAIILGVAITAASLWKAVDLLQWSRHINDEVRRRLGVGR